MGAVVDNTVVLGVLLAIAAGAGAALRWAAELRLNREFPSGTLIINVVAAFLLGLIAAAGDPIPAVVGIGALGALSTWSATANEVATMARDGQGPLAGAYLGLSCTGGILAAWFGLQLSPLIF